MPYREATALITVEREGVLDARVVKLSGKSPVIEIPIKAGWAPNVFVSALVVRGRNDEVKPTALVDLGRPSFKLGIAGIEVGQRAHRLEVEVKTDRARYQIREKAKARIKVRTPKARCHRRHRSHPGGGGRRPAGTGAQQQLEPARSDDGGTRLQHADLHRANAGHRQTPLRQESPARRRWRRQIADARTVRHAAVLASPRRPRRNGEASVEIPLNDSLTAFRIVAIAASENRFGTGKTAIRSSQDLQLISGLSPVVREGDRLQAYFTRAQRQRTQHEDRNRSPPRRLKDLPTRS
jgi:alpha-2-macroglobulin